MRAVIQRVSRASVSVDGEMVGAIESGLLVLLGIARDDTAQDIAYLAEKIATLRICEDAEGRMNLSVAETGGGALVVSQFTLYGDARRGRRPSWSEAAPPEIAEPLYEQFVAVLRQRVARVATGTFRAMMQVELVNDGPVTILLDSRKLF
jgi:D-tyrosyl-tRNA(Tyr) deacylase